MQPATCSFDPELLTRLVRPGPRYTSYPPATRFAEGFGAADAAAELERLGRTLPDAPASLYLHIPYCRSLCWYCGCNVVITRQRDRVATYIDTLIDELALVARHLGPGRPLTELALGGGSPNIATADDLRRLMGAVRRHFDVTPDAELGVELDPRDTTREQLDALASLGFRRMSVGIQDFDPEVQRAIHRTQSVEQTAALIEHARAAGFTTVNADLIYGLPLQSPETFAATLDAVVALAPDRVALFGYAHLPEQRPHQRLVERAGPLPDTTGRAALLGVALARFAAADYVRVGMDHFARPGDALARAAAEGTVHRNFQGYVPSRAAYLVACGTTGISDSSDAYWQNHADLAQWRRCVEEGVLPVGRGVALDRDDHIRRFVIGRLMCQGELSFSTVEQAFDLSFEEYFAPELAELDGGACAELVTREHRRLGTTELGGLLVRNVAMLFDRYLREAGSTRPRFSPTL
jgi:oxygen-independent coproporphyrinogen III oxidase